MPYPVEEMLERIAAHVERFPPAAMFGLAARGHDSLHEQLVSCGLSIRTYDETSYPASVALFERARTPAEMLALGRAALVRIVAACTYPEQKAGSAPSSSSCRPTPSRGSRRRTNGERWPDTSDGRVASGPSGRARPRARSSARTPGAPTSSSPRVGASGAVADSGESRRPAGISLLTSRHAARRLRRRYR